MYVCALKQVFNTVSFWDRTTDGNKRNKQTERRKDRFVSRSRALRGNDQRCEQLKTRQWHYQQTVDNNIVWHINTYDLNKKIPSYDCFVWVSRTRPFLLLLLVLVRTLARVDVFVWRIGCDLFYRNFIHNSNMSIHTVHERHGVHNSTLTHIHGTFIVVQSNWSKPKNERKKQQNDVVVFSFSQLNSNWKKSNNKMQR